MKLCTYKECDRALYAKGLCQLHYDRKRRGADMDLPPRGERKCSVEGCIDPHEAKGYCNSHYRRFRKGLDVGAVIWRRGARKSENEVLYACTIDGCERNTDGRYMCSTHRDRARRGVDMNTDLRVERKWDDTLLPSILDNSTQSGECMISSYKPGHDGYIRLSVDGRKLPLHRIVMSVSLSIPIDELPPIHHKCANRRCINPEHLQPVTHRENTAEMLERNYYINRINELEDKVQELESRLETVTNG